MEDLHAFFRDVKHKKVQRKMEECKDLKLRQSELISLLYEEIALAYATNIPDVHILDQLAKRKYWLSGVDILWRLASTAAYLSRQGMRVLIIVNEW